jgi:hypothetical protein
VLKYSNCEINKSNNSKIQKMKKIEL